MFVFQVEFNRSITSKDVHELLASIPDLDADERDLIKEARSAVSKQWEGFLKNARITIKLDDQDIILKTGKETNKLVVKEEADGKIHCEWEEQGIGMKIMSGAKHIGRFLFALLRKTVSDVTLVALEHVLEKLPAITNKT